MHTYTEVNPIEISENYFQANMEGCINKKHLFACYEEYTYHSIISFNFFTGHMQLEQTLHGHVKSDNTKPSSVAHIYSLLMLPTHGISFHFVISG